MHICIHVCRHPCNDIYVCMRGHKYTLHTYLSIYLWLYVCVCIYAISMYTFRYVCRKKYMSLYIGRHLYMYTPATISFCDEN